LIILDLARLGKARRGVAKLGKAGRGKARLGKAWHGIVLTTGVI
jgi:hypothetical protein